MLGDLEPEAEQEEMGRAAALNTTVSWDGFCAVETVVNELQRFAVHMRRNGLMYTDWCGRLDFPVEETFANMRGDEYEPVGLVDEWRIPWTTYWEYAWVLSQSGVLEGGFDVLELGGAASLFGAYVAAMGNRVTVVDKRKNVRRGERNASALGFDLTGVQGNLSELATLVGSQKFDHVLSISCLHLCGPGALQEVKASLASVTKPGARFSFSFDLGNPNPKREIVDPAYYFETEGFRLRGDGAFHDTSERYHLYYPAPEMGTYTVAAMFMERE